MDITEASEKPATSANSTSLAIGVMLGLLFIIGLLIIIVITVIYIIRRMRRYSAKSFYNFEGT